MLTFKGEKMQPMKIQIYKLDQLMSDHSHYKRIYHFTNGFPARFHFHNSSLSVRSHCQLKVNQK